MSGRPLHGKIFSRQIVKETKQVHYAITIIGTVEAATPAEGRQMAYDDIMDVAGNVRGATDLYVTLRRTPGSRGYNPSEPSRFRQKMDTHTRAKVAAKARWKRSKSGHKTNVAAIKQYNTLVRDWEWADMHDVDRRFHNNIMSLTKEERIVLAHRYGLNNVKTMTPATVQGMFNLTSHEYKKTLGNGLRKLGLAGFKRGIKVVPAEHLRSADTAAAGGV